MEQSYLYKGYHIDYSTFGGTTTIRDIFTIKKFVGLGLIKGDELARKFIDNL